MLNFRTAVYPPPSHNSLFHKLIDTCIYPQLLQFMSHFALYDGKRANTSPWECKMKWAGESDMAAFKAVFEAAFPNIAELRVRGPKGVRGTLENAALQLSVNFKTQQSVHTFKMIYATVLRLVKSKLEPIQLAKPPKLPLQYDTLEGFGVDRFKVCCLCLRQYIIVLIQAHPHCLRTQSISAHNVEVARQLLAALGIDAGDATTATDLNTLFTSAKSDPPPPDASESDDAKRAQQWLQDCCPVTTEGANDQVFSTPPDGTFSVDKQLLKNLAYKVAQSLCCFCIPEDTEDASPSVDVDDARLQPLVDQTLTTLWGVVKPCVDARGGKCVNQMKYVRAVCGNYFFHAPCA